MTHACLRFRLGGFGRMPQPARSMGGTVASLTQPVVAFFRVGRGFAAVHCAGKGAA